MNSREAAEVLGLTPEASPVEVRRAYRSIIRTLHPDLAGSGATPDAVRVIEAYGVLRAERVVADADRPGGPGVRRAPADGARPPASPLPPAAIVRMEDDTIAFGAPADETLLLLLEAAHDLGELTYLDRSMPIIEVICQFQGTPTLSLVITLQGRCDGTEAFCTVESIEAGAGPPAGAVVDVLFDLLRQRQTMAAR